MGLCASGHRPSTGISKLPVPSQLNHLWLTRSFGCRPSREANTPQQPLLCSRPLPWAKSTPKQRGQPESSAPAGSMVRACSVQGREVITGLRSALNGQHGFPCSWGTSMPSLAPILRACMPLGGKGVMQDTLSVASCLANRS